MKLNTNPTPALMEVRLAIWVRGKFKLSAHIDHDEWPDHAGADGADEHPHEH